MAPPPGHGVVLLPHAVEHPALQLEEVGVLGGQRQALGGGRGGLGQAARPSRKKDFLLQASMSKGLRRTRSSNTPTASAERPSRIEDLGEAVAGLGVLAVHVQGLAAGVGGRRRHARAVPLLGGDAEEGEATLELPALEQLVQVHGGLGLEPAPPEDVGQEEVGLE